MATWNKIIVSGSQAELAGITGSLLTDDKLLFAKDGGAISSTEITVNESGHLDGTFSGSFSGSFTGDLTGTASYATTADKVKSKLTGSNGIETFSFDGSADASVAVKISGSTLTVGPDGVAVNASGITTTELANGAVTYAKLSTDSVVTAAEIISPATTGSDDNLATTKAIYEFVTNQVGGATLNITGSGNTAVSLDLNDEDLIFAGEAGVMSVSASVAEGDVTITTAIVDGGISNAKLTHDGLAIGTTDITLGTTASTIDGLTLTEVVATGSFTGSFAGDGSELTGIASSLTISASDASGDTNDLINLKTEALNFASVANETEIQINPSTDTITIGLPDDVTIAGDLSVQGDLVVTGTASFRHEEILEIADQFILMGSGSTTAQPGGIVVQQATQDVGELFGFDDTTQRWGVTGSFDSTSDTFSPDAFMATVVVGGVGENDPSNVDSKYLKKGNMFIGADQSIYIITAE